MKTGVLGGTFNPIHSGHIHLARAYLEALELDRILIIPTNIPPHKGAGELVDGLYRLKMCTLAVAHELRLEVSNLELKRPGPSYTADTLQELRALYPQDSFYFLMGSDMFLTVESWNRAGELLAGGVLCTAARDEGEEERLRTYAKELSQRKAVDARVLSVPPLSVSSTQIREMVRAGEPLGELVPGEVEDYILQNGLYGSDASAYPWPMERYRQEMERMQTPERMAHSLEVSKEAVRLARRYGGPQTLCRVAGLLHDICKCIPKERQLQIILSAGGERDEVLLQLPHVWHGLAAAVHLERELKLYNQQILNAVRYHTIGRAGMSLVEKLIYLADLTSADRIYGDVEKMRRLVDESLDGAMREALAYSVGSLVKTNTPLCQDTIAACREYGVLPDEGSGHRLPECGHRRLLD